MSEVPDESDKVDDDAPAALGEVDDDDSKRSTTEKSESQRKLSAALLTASAVGKFKAGAKRAKEKRTALRDPDAAGYLLKKGHLIPSWRKRYFVLYGRELTYFESEADFERKRNAAGKGASFATGLVKGRVKVRAFDPWEDAARDHAFIIHSSSDGADKRFYVQATEVADRRLWSRVLRAACGQEPDPADSGGTASAGCGGASAYSVTLGAVDLGIEWVSAVEAAGDAAAGGSGVDAGAVVSGLVAGGAAATDAAAAASLKPGHRLLAVGARSVEQLTFRATMNLLGAEEKRPLTLRLTAAPAGAVGPAGAGAGGGTGGGDAMDHRFLAGEWRSWFARVKHDGEGSANKALTHLRAGEDGGRIVVCVDDEGIKAFALRQRGGGGSGYGADALGRGAEQPPTFEVRLAGGLPLGLKLQSNYSGARIFGVRSGRRYSGMDFSAVVEAVTGQAAAGGELFPGNYLLAINGADTTKLTFARTMKALQDAQAAAAAAAASATSGTGGGSAASAKAAAVTLTVLGTLSPVHIARSEFSSRLLREWPFEELVQWEAQEASVLTKSGLTNAADRLAFSFDHYRPKSRGGKGVATHVSLECAPGEAEELQKYLEAKVHAKLAAATAGPAAAAAAAVGPAAAAEWKLGEGAAAERSAMPAYGAAVIAATSMAMGAAAMAGGAAAGAAAGTASGAVAVVGGVAGAVAGSAVASAAATGGGGGAAADAADAAAAERERKTRAGTAARAQGGITHQSHHAAAPPSPAVAEVHLAHQSAHHPAFPQCGADGPMVGAPDDVYRVTLGPGPLGLKLESNEGDAPDLSARVQAAAGASAVPGLIAPGHFLWSVNGETTVALPFAETMEALKRAARPLTLVFWRAAPDASGSYTVTLHGQSLGLGLAKGRPDRGAIVESCAPAGAADACQKIAVGQKLTGVGTLSVAQMTFKATMAVLRQAPRPIRLSFQLMPPAASVMPPPQLMPGSRGGRRYSAVNAPPPPTSAAMTAYEAMFGEGPLGLGLASRHGGAAGSALVESLQGAAAASRASIKVGDVIVAVNGRETAGLSFDETMSLLKAATRPLKLVLRRAEAADGGGGGAGGGGGGGGGGVVPMSAALVEPRIPDTDNFRGYTVQDPSGGFPEEVALAVGPAGVQVLAPATHATVCFWPWKHVASWKVGAGACGAAHARPPRCSSLVRGEASHPPLPIILPAARVTRCCL